MIKEVLAELSTFIELRKQRVTLDLAEQLPHIMVDSEKIRLVLLNLIQNAVKFTPDGGEIRAFIKSQGDNVNITIEDTGIGISDCELERIFEKFYTTPDTLHHTSGKYEFGAR